MSWNIYNRQAYSKCIRTLLSYHIMFAVVYIKSFPYLRTSVPHNDSKTFIKEKKPLKDHSGNTQASFTQQSACFRFSCCPFALLVCLCSHTRNGLLHKLADQALVESLWGTRSTSHGTHGKI